VRIEIGEDDEPQDVLSEVERRLREAGWTDAADQLSTLVEAEEGIMDLAEVRQIEKERDDLQQDVWELEARLARDNSAKEVVHRLHGGIEVDPSLCQHPECWRLWH
jgi:hypothetical protein